jgi:transposase
MSKKFSSSFKKQSAELVTIKGYSIAKARAVAGVGDTAMRRWVNQLRDELAGHTPEGSSAITDAQIEIQKLKAKIKDLEEDKEILKKATALLMSEAGIGRK